ncbi:MAG TPA: NYN domain-containing protein [Acidimicrobiia bacterium]|nr:NYN domain-containing protein [Acidimicrobiia bacterium]
MPDARLRRISLWGAFDAIISAVAVTTGERMSSPPRRAPLPPVPEPLLVPLLDAAGEMLRALDPIEVPPILRPVAEFDRRGLARGAARQQLMRAIESEGDFRQRAVERFTDRVEVSEALEAWDASHAVDVVGDAVERSMLPTLASALYAAQPPGWEFGLGVVCAVYDRQRLEQQLGDDHRERESQLAGMAESRRRAEAARVAAEQKAEAIERQLRDERQSRRDRDAAANQRVGAAEQKLADLEHEIIKARAAVEAAEGRLEREASRARKLDDETRDLRRAAKEAEAKSRSSEGDTGLPVLRREDLRALVDAADLAQRLATGLTGVADQARRVMPEQTPALTEPEQEQEPGGPKAGAPRRRAQPRVPPGMVEDDPDALDAMLRTPRAVLVVDGYNVSMLAWGDVPPAQQRDRLLNAVSELQLRTRARIVLVFDGADVGSVLPPRRPGVRVVFSPEGEEADVVVVRQAGDLPVEVPVVVASSDAWVGRQARETGARVVSSATLLRALRR